MTANAGSTPELRWLRTFRSVARELHFGRAAEQLNLTQSAVSTHIAHLERDLGVALLVRGPRSTRLTEAGRFYLARAEEILESADAAARLVRRMADGGVDEVVVAYNAGFAGRALRALAAAVSAQAPETTLRVAGTMTNRAVVDAVRRGRVDIGLCAGEDPVDGLRDRVVGDARLHALVPSAVVDDPLEAAVIGRSRLVLPAASDGLTLRSLALDFLEASGCSAPVIVEASDGPTVHALVAAGAGIGFATSGADALTSSGARIAPIAQAPAVPIRVVWRAEEGGAIDRLAALVPDDRDPRSGDLEPSLDAAAERVRPF